MTPMMMANAGMNAGFMMSTSPASAMIRLMWLTRSAALTRMFWTARLM